MVYTADEWQQYHQSKDKQMKKDAIIEKKLGFPCRLHAAIDEAKEENLRPKRFLLKIKNKLLELLFENWYVDDDIDESKGLNCDRDTEAEVELAIRFFPNVLSKKRNGRYLIYYQLSTLYGQCNLKAASFVPLFAKLAIELNQCVEGKRGGLICGKWNVLRILAKNFRSICERDDRDEAYQKRIDNAFLAVMKKLRDDGLFKKEDIQECDMIEELCMKPIFSEQRFRYLADWDPSYLMLPSDSGFEGWLPIQYAILRCKDIRGFRTVFEVGIHHFPKKMGGLFHKDRCGRCTAYKIHCKKFGNEEVKEIISRTAYQMACKKFGNEEVKEILKNILNHGFIKKQMNINALLKSLVYAATVETVHLDGVFEILQQVLQREPSALQVQVAASRNIKSDKNSQKRKSKSDENGRESDDLGRDNGTSRHSTYRDLQTTTVEANTYAKQNRQF